MHVISIIGWGRSGSTILDRTVGSVPGAFPTGELRYLAERLLGGGTCGCGAPLDQCALWSAVISRAGLADADPAVTVELLSRLARVRHTKKLLETEPGDGSRRPGLGDLVDWFERLYAGIAEVTGSQLVVDSSKFPSHGALLCLVPGIQVSFVQLVRDPRAVAYSWSRPKPGPDPIPRVGSVFSSTKWMQWNLACEKIKGVVGAERYLTLRYEDFVAAPVDAFTRVLALANVDTDVPTSMSDDHAVLSSNHTINGNPDRFVTGAVKIREDTRWLRSQRVAPWSVSTTLTAPLLRRYGYEWRRGAPWQRRAAVE
jgi:hypothetical protein